MQRIQTVLSSMVVMSALTHIFCCGLPLVFSVLSLITVLGISVATPAGLTAFHDALHDYEAALLVFSAVMVATGWGLHLLGEKLDCRREGACHHEPCAPKKRKSVKLLFLATFLLVLNGFVYVLFHENGSYTGHVITHSATHHEVHAH